LGLFIVLRFVTIVVRWRNGRWAVVGAVR
jgi:hypothetical protein